MKPLGQAPRASWFPAVLVGVPSCQTDWLFTNDPVNQKSPSKALSSCESVTEIKSFWRRFGYGKKEEKLVRREQRKVEWIKGRLAWGAQCFGGMHVTSVWGTKACAETHQRPCCHTFARHNHKWLWTALHQTWHFCLKEGSEPIVALFLPFYFPE